MPGVSSHEKGGIAVATGMLTAKERVQTVVKYFGPVQNAFGLDLGYG